MVRVGFGTFSEVSAYSSTSIDTFYIGRHELTWEEWQTVRAWAVANGYDIGGRGAGFGWNHPEFGVVV